MEKGHNGQRAPGGEDTLPGVREEEQNPGVSAPQLHGRAEWEEEMRLERQERCLLTLCNLPRETARTPESAMKTQQCQLSVMCGQRGTEGGAHRQLMSHLHTPSDAIYRGQEMAQPV